MRRVEDEDMKQDRSSFYLHESALAEQAQYIGKNLEYMVFSSVQRTLTGGTMSNIPINKRKKLKKFDFTLPSLNTLMPSAKTPKN